MTARTGIEPGGPAWFDGEQVTVRLVCMGAEPYVAWLTDGRSVPKAELVSRADLVAECQGVGW